MYHAYWYALVNIRLSSALASASRKNWASVLTESTPASARNLKDSCDVIKTNLAINRADVFKISELTSRSRGKISVHHLHQQRSRNHHHSCELPEFCISSQCCPPEIFRPNSPAGEQTRQLHFFSWCPNLRVHARLQYAEY